MWTKFINKYHLNLYHHNPTGKSVRIFCEGASLQTLILAKMIRLTFKMTCCTFVIPQILLAGSQIRSYLTQYILNFSKLLFKLINYHCYIVKSKLILPLSWRRSLSYRNQSIDLQSKWFLYDRILHHETIKLLNYYYNRFRMLHHRSPWTQDVNWTQLRRSEDALGRLLNVLCTFNLSPVSRGMSGFSIIWITLFSHELKILNYDGLWEKNYWMKINASIG